MAARKRRKRSDPAWAGVAMHRDHTATIKRPAESPLPTLDQCIAAGTHMIRCTGDGACKVCYQMAEEDAAVLSAWAPPPAQPRCATEMGCLCFAHANGVPASEPCNAAEVQSFIDYAVEDAKRHGEDSEPDHEVGDLQGLAYACWKHLDAKGRRAVIAEVSPFMWTPPTEAEAAITDSNHDQESTR